MSDRSVGAGSVLSGRYRLEAPLASGGMGTVWRAEDLLLVRPVAVKEVRLPQGLDDEKRAMLRRRTMREAQSAARLRHPAIVTIYDVVEQDDRPWIVMELIESPNLADVIRERGPQPPVRVASIGMRILDAMITAQAAGVQHRDIKPANVMIADDGRVVLTDFGIARHVGDETLTSAGLLVGSPDYLAPERARGHASPGLAAELWSLGATMYDAVEGRRPFEREGALPTLAAVVMEDPAPMRLAGPLRPVISGLLEKDPVRRLGVDATRQQLQRVLRGRPPGGTLEMQPEPSTLRDLPVRRPTEATAVIIAADPPPAEPPGAAEEKLSGRAGAGTAAAAAAAVAAPGVPSVAPPAGTGPAGVAAPSPDTADRPAAGTADRPAGTAADPSPGTADAADRPPAADPSPGTADVADRPPAAEPSSADRLPAADPSSAAADRPTAEAADRPHGTAVAASSLAAAGAAAAAAAAHPRPATDPGADSSGLAADPRTAAVANPSPAPPRTDVPEPTTRVADPRTDTPEPATARVADPRPTPEPATTRLAEPAASTRVAPAAPPTRTDTRDPAPPATRPRRDRRRPVLAGVAALILAGSAALLLPRALADEDPPGSAAPAATTAGAPAATDGTAGTAGAPAASATAAPTTTGRPATTSPTPAPTSAPASPTATSAPRPRTGADVAVPAGFTRYRDASRGWTVVVPAGWTPERSGTLVDFEDPTSGRFLRIDTSTTPRADPYQNWIEYERQYSAGKSNYTELGIRRVPTYRPDEGWTTADWEFRIGGTHVLNRNIRVSDSRAHALYWSTPESLWNSAESKRIFALAADSFTP